MSEPTIHVDGIKVGDSKCVVCHDEVSVGQILDGEAVITPYKVGDADRGFHLLHAYCEV